jgi:hypothetical protein
MDTNARCPYGVHETVRNFLWGITSIAAAECWACRIAFTAPLTGYRSR